MVRIFGLTKPRIVPLRAFLLFMCVRVYVPDPSDEKRKEPCEALITIGKFSSEREAKGWATAFKAALMSSSGEVLVSWTRAVSPQEPRRVDYDPNMEYGLPSEVASYMAEYVPEKERVEIGKALAIAYKCRED